MVHDHTLHEVYVCRRPRRQGGLSRRRQPFARGARGAGLHHYRRCSIRLLCAHGQGEENCGNGRGEQCPYYNGSHRARLVLAAGMTPPPAWGEGENFIWARTESFRETGNFHGGRRGEPTGTNSDGTSRKLSRKWLHGHKVQVQCHIDIRRRHPPEPNSRRKGGRRLQT
jgi:hypothetical protein